MAKLHKIQTKKVQQTKSTCLSICAWECTNLGLNYIWLEICMQSMASLFIFFIKNRQPINKCAFCSVCQQFFWYCKNSTVFLHHSVKGRACENDLTSTMMERNIRKRSQMNDSAGFRLRINTLARKCCKMHSGRYGCIEALFPKSNAASISGWIS